MLRTLFISLLIYCTTLTVTAQSINATITPATAKQIVNKTAADWPKSAPAAKLPQETLDIVTASQPDRRQHCRVREIDAHAISCHHHRGESVYQRNDILAIIQPPAYKNFVGFMELAGVLGVTLAASFFVPFGWAIALRIISGFLLIGGWGAYGESYDGLASLGYFDHSYDILIYQRPNTPLTVKLRTR